MEKSSFSLSNLATIGLVTFGLGVVGSSILRPAASQKDPIRWEYRVEAIADQNFIEKMNQLGAQGWEMGSSRRAATETGDELAANDKAVSEHILKLAKYAESNELRRIVETLAVKWEEGKSDPDALWSIARSARFLRTDALEKSNLDPIGKNEAQNEAYLIIEATQARTKLLAEPLATNEIIFKRLKPQPTSK